MVYKKVYKAMFNEIKGMINGKTIFEVTKNFIGDTVYVFPFMSYCFMIGFLTIILWECVIYIRISPEVFLCIYLFIMSLLCIVIRVLNKKAMPNIMSLHQL